MPIALLALVINPCHNRKTGEGGREYMVENRQLFHCLECPDKNHCWDGKTLAEKIFHQQRDLLNQDY